MDQINEIIGEEDALDTSKSLAPAKKKKKKKKKKKAPVEPPIEVTAVEEQTHNKFDLATGAIVLDSDLDLDVEAEAIVLDRGADPAAETIAGPFITSKKPT